MAQSSYHDAANLGNTEFGFSGELSRNDALALLRLLSPQSTESTFFSANILPTPNGGQLYMTPQLGL
jgi:hypothetical protein